LWRAFSLGGLLFLIWLLLSGHYTPLLISFGAASCVLIVLIARRMEIVDSEGHSLYWLFRMPRYWLWLAKEIVVSNIDVMRHVLRPKLDISPTLVTTQALQKTDFGKVLYANSITLTPGTTTLLLEGDQITVHALSKAGADSLEQNAMNQRVAKLGV